MGEQQKLLKEIERQQSLFVGVTSEGVIKLSQNTIKKMGEGNTYFGSLNTPKDKISPLLDAFYIDNIQDKLLEKVAINAAINPLSALFNITNGELLSSDYKNILNACCDEIDKIIQAAFPEKPSYKDKTYKVIKATENNHSSMQQDLTYKRKTEIINISGYLIDLAKSAKIHAPIQDKLLSAILGQDSQDKIKGWLTKSF